MPQSATQSTTHEKLWKLRSIRNLTEALLPVFIEHQPLAWCSLFICLGMALPLTTPFALDRSQDAEEDEDGVADDGSGDAAEEGVNSD
jgi:hypothetical protein